MSSQMALDIVVVVVLISFSAYFSATETAFTSANRIRMKNMAGDGNKKAERVLRLLSDYDKLLTTILVGNNIVNIMVASIGTLLFVGLYGDIGATISTVVVTIVVLIFGEITPKTLANDQAETFCMRAAPALRVCLVILTPLHLFFSLFQKAAIRLFRSSEDEGITEEELITMVEEAENEGGLEHHESELIRAAIEFNDMEVEDILTPRVDIVAAPDTITMEEFAVLFAENGYSRIPVYHGSIDNIIGVVHEKDFFSARYHNHTDVISLVSKVFYTTGSSKISDLLRLLQLRKTHMAVVVDEYGGTAGLITMEDLIESILGNIQDEYDNETEDIEQVSENLFTIDGTTDIEEVSELLDRELPEGEYDTLGGMIMSYLGRIPAPEEHPTVEVSNILFTVLSLDERRIDKVRAEKLPQPEQGKDADKEKEKTREKEKDKAKKQEKE